MSEAILDQQDIKNMEATQNEPISFTPTWEQVAQFAKQAEEMDLGKMIENNIMENRQDDMIKAHFAKLEKESKEIDPNDQVETTERTERTDPTEVLEVERRECYGLN